MHRSSQLELEAGVRGLEAEALVESPRVGTSGVRRELDQAAVVKLFGGCTRVGQRAVSDSQRVDDSGEIVNSMLPRLDQVSTSWRYRARNALYHFPWVFWARQNRRVLVLAGGVVWTWSNQATEPQSHSEESVVFSGA